MLCRSGQLVEDSNVFGTDANQYGALKLIDGAHLYSGMRRLLAPLRFGLAPPF
jgi:hypothetical protein